MGALYAMKPGLGIWPSNSECSVSVDCVREGEAWETKLVEVLVFLSASACRGNES